MNTMGEEYEGRQKSGRFWLNHELSGKVAEHESLEVQDQLLGLLRDLTDIPIDVDDGSTKYDVIFHDSTASEVIVAAYIMGRESATPESLRERIATVEERAEKAELLLAKLGEYVIKEGGNNGKNYWDRSRNY